MAYSIVINLDYDSHPAETCQFLWAEIKECMVTAGFHADGRRFTINLPSEEACALARKVIDSLEDHLEYHSKHIYKYMKDFYGFPAEQRTNLLLPPISSIQVEGVD